MSSEEEKLLKEAKKLPWEDRLSHKNWKVRNEANIDLAGLCDSITDPKDARLREFGMCCFFVCFVLVRCIRLFVVCGSFRMMKCGDCFFRAFV